jgi:antitoxin MazE
MSVSGFKNLKVAKWGSSLAVRLPQVLAAELGGSGGKVRFTMVSNKHAAENMGGFAEGEQAPFVQAPAEATIGKWGNSLGVRLPADLANQLGLKEGDMLTLTNDGAEVAVERQRTRAEALESFRKARGAFTGSVRFSREDLLLRGPDVTD